MYLVRFFCKRRVIAILCYMTIFINICSLMATWTILMMSEKQSDISDNNIKYGNGDLDDTIRFITTTNIAQPNLDDSTATDVFTYDLPPITNYSFVQGKQFKEYVIPVMTEKEASYGPNLDPLTVLIIPFSHVDPGYGSTMESYYAGKTKHTLNHMVKKLSQHRNMTFQWAETVFLERWWRDIDDEVKGQARRLIQNGQLEIVLGGWVMPDEASTHYVSVIDQLVEGHQWVLENLGVKPRNSWSNDPFGFSSTMPYLWKKAGMQNMVILRIHQAIKATLMKLRTMEFNWQQLWSKDTSNEILCHLMPYRGYWIGDVCGPYNQHICREYAFHRRDPIHKVVFVNEDNVAERSRILYEQYRITAEIYRRHGLTAEDDDSKVQLFLPIFLGEDFSFTSDDEFELIYTNYKMLFDHINANRDWKTTIKFGTLKEYFSLIRQYQSDRNTIDGSRFPTLAGDFFPYSDYQNDYWTGYYTTRPFNKQLASELQYIIRLADIMHTYAFAYSKNQKAQYTSFDRVMSDLRDARRELGMFLHHDGITGTSVTWVLEDFRARLLSAYRKSKNALRLAVGRLLTPQQFIPNDALLSDIADRKVDKSISTLNVLKISPSGSKIFAINPTGRKRIQVINFLTDTKVSITDSSNRNIDDVQLKNMPSAHRVSLLVEVAPFGIEALNLHKTDNILVDKNEIQDDDDNKKYVISNEYLTVEFDTETGLLRKIIDHAGGQHHFNISVLAYTSLRSGAYIFAPKGKAQKYLIDKPGITVSRGPLVSEISVNYVGFRMTTSLHHVTGVQGQGVHIHTELNMKAFRSTDKEVIIRFESDIKSANNFYTDQNGFQLMGRKTYPERPVEQNYYPVTSMAVIEDDLQRLTLHAAQPHGVASLQSGWLEVMLDRQVSRDDGKGLGQGVNDNVLTVANFVLQIENVKLESPVVKKEYKYTFPTLSAVLVNEMLKEPVYTLFLKDVAEANGRMMSTVTPMSEALQCGVYVVGMRTLAKSNLQYNGTSLILHRKSILKDGDISKNICNSAVDQESLKRIFPQLEIKSSKETTLTHLDDLKDISIDDDISPKNMEIRAFKIEF